MTDLLADNPLLQTWTAPHGLPPFDRLRPEHFEPALHEAMRRHRDELQAIATDPRAPDFDNTYGAFDRSGRLLVRIEAVFDNLTSSATTDALQAVQSRLAGPLAAHRSAMYQDPALFARMDAVHAQRASLGLDAESMRLVDRVHRAFVKRGARLAPPQRARDAALRQRLATLQTRFSQNVLADEAQQVFALRDEADLAGLPAAVRDALRQAALDRRMDAPYAVTLSRSAVVPFLTHSARADLRERVWRAWTTRGESAPERDNRPLLTEILQARAELAALHGHPHYAAYALADTMAGTVDRVQALFDQVWPRALAAMARERTQIAERLRAEGVAQDPDTLAPWDWRVWAEKVRQHRYALDDAEIKPYFALDRMVAAAFDCAHRLFGVSFRRRDDLPVYHPDVVAYEVLAADGQVKGIFLHDNFARPGKRSGAWMSALRDQSRHAGAPVLPIVLNNNNFARGGAGEPTLLSFDDVRTLFHEFGHGLHGLMSDVTWDTLSGTAVLRDFVELPSQLFEHWALEDEVIRRHARHHVTGEPLPDALLQKLRQARYFGQGYETVRFMASALVDMAVHALPEPPADPVAFEADLLRRLGHPASAGLNHRLPHFQHLFSGDGYAAGYYVYLWAEVLDADAYGAFEEAGDPFDAATAQRLLRHIYAAGDSVAPEATYTAFRGRMAAVEPMLRKKGLLAAAEPA